MNSHPAPLNSNGKPVILLVEDDPDQSDMLREALEDEGYRVETAFSGDVALRKLFQHDYALVLLDIRMPGLDGVSVLKRYRKDKMGPQSPVIVVSAFATESDLITYREAGATSSMAKPYELDMLLAAVASLIHMPERT